MLSTTSFQGNLQPVTSERLPSDPNKRTGNLAATSLAAGECKFPAPASTPEIGARRVRGLSMNLLLVGGFNPFEKY